MLVNWIDRWKNLSKAEQAHTHLMIAWTVLFAVGTCLFWFAPVGVVENFRKFAGLVVPMDSFEPLPEPAERFWSALALSLMTTLTFLCAAVAWDIRRYLNWTIPVLVSKAASTCFFFYFYLTDRQAWAYLGGALLSDGPIFVCTLIFYFFARRAQIRVLAGTGA